jgi:hypothetical protein
MFAGPEAPRNIEQYNISQAFDANGSAAMARWVRDMRSFDTALF